MNVISQRGLSLLTLFDVPTMDDCDIIQIRVLAFSVGFNFFVTLSLFPSITASIATVSDQNSKYYTTLFVPIFCFVGFNVGDYIGRTLAGLYHLVRRPWATGFLRPDRHRAAGKWTRPSRPLPLSLAGCQTLQARSFPHFGPGDLLSSVYSL